MNPRTDPPGAPTRASGSRASRAADLHVIAPPPLVFLAAILLGALLDRLVPLGIAPRDVGLGAAVVLVAVAANVWALLAFRRAGTSVVPRGQTRAFVASGPYLLTRNPMYVALAILSVGIFLILGSAWGYPLLALSLVLIHFGVIKREEAHLEARFGQDCFEYKRRVRRWV